MTIAKTYTKNWLQVNRPQPMYDKNINKFYNNIFKSINPIFIEENLFDNFKKAFRKWLDNHQMSSFRGLDTFARQDICIGVTHYIDNLYMKLGNRLRVFENDYKYHWRLNNDIEYATLKNLKKGEELLISMPFPFYGDCHPQMKNILDTCYSKEIPVHIDGAWISCSKNINFDFSHPAIESFSSSLSKGGLGANRIGCRFTKHHCSDSITLMNDFNMVPNSLVYIGLEFINSFGSEYFWIKYGPAYEKVCSDFDLYPTNSIHLALTRNGEPRGVRPLLRYLADNHS